MLFFKNLFKQDIFSTGLLKGAVEIHSHILPGVDDGFQESGKSVYALKWMMKQGYRKVFFTPHIMTDWGSNNYHSLTTEFNEFTKKAPQGLELGLAAEYMLDADFEKRINEPMLSFDGKHVLVETSYMAPSPIMAEQLFQLRMKGNVPIFAHPERYVYLKPSDYRSLKSDGLLFQLNLMSLCGAYGFTAEQKARFLLKEGLYDFVGSDVHRFTWLKNGMEALRLSKGDVAALTPLFEASKSF